MEAFVVSSAEQLQSCPLFVTSVTVRFELGRNVASAAALEALCVRLPNLQSLDLSDTALGDDFPEAMVRSTLRSLVMANNRLTNAGALRLASIVAGRARHLAVLNVADNSIGDEGALAICKAIEKSATLQALSLAGNTFRKRAAVVSLLAMNTSLVHADVGGAVDETLDLVARQNKLFAEALLDPGVVSSSFSNRKWAHCPTKIFNWQHMESLNLSYNSLTEVPYHILRLRNLKVLNLSSNCIASHSMPVHLHKLSQLARLSVRENPFVADLPGDVVWRETQPLLSYFKSIASDPVETAVESASLRVVFLGDPAVGKSSLIQGLSSGKGTRGDKRIIESLSRITKSLRSSWAQKSDAQDGSVDVSQVKCEEGNYSFSLWDFACAPSLVQFLLFPSSVFVCVFSLIDARSLQNLTSWVELVLSKCLTVDLIIVGTHRDKCQNAEEVIASLRKRFLRMKHVVLHAVLAVNKASSASMKQLYDAIAAVGAKPQFASVRVAPRSFLFLRALVSLEPMMRLSEFEAMCDACCVADKKRTLQFLAADNVLYYPRIPSLQDRIFCDPTWLVQVMTRAVTVPDGSFTQDDVETLFQWNLFGPNFVIVDLLECFDLIHRIRVVRESSGDVVSRYVVPCILPSKEPLDDVARLKSLMTSSHNAIVIRRIYRFVSAPPDFMALFCVRMLSFASSLYGAAIWSHGCVCILEEDDTRHLLSAQLSGRDLELEVTTSDFSGRIVHLFVSATDSFFSGWFPNAEYKRFIKMRGSNGEASVDELLQTLMSITSQEAFFRLSGSIIRRFETAAPDLVLRRMKRVRPEDLRIMKEIGAGSFGSVYLAEFERKRVVVKELRTMVPEMSDSSGAEASAAFSNFSNECIMMSCLVHEKIVQLIGISMRSISGGTVMPSFVLELACYGDLRHALDTMRKCNVEMPWELRLKILIDMADGMAYSHRLVPAVLHRDLKSPNVFLSCTETGGVVAKIADLGLATVLSQKVQLVDNCIWLAPEAIQQNVCDEKVDVYSFGIIMWETMTGKFPFENELRLKKFFSVLGSDIVMGLRPSCSNEANAPVGFKELMQRAWSHLPGDRPSFRECAALLISMQSQSASLKDGRSLIELGNFEVASVSPILSFDLRKDAVVAVTQSGTVLHLTLTGVGHKLASLPSPAVTSHDGQCGLLGDVALANSRGAVYKVSLSSAAIADVRPSTVVRVAFFADVAGWAAVVGYSDNTLESVYCELRKADTLELVEVIPLMTTGGSQKILSHCVVGKSLWTLYQDASCGQHRIVTLSFDKTERAFGTVKVPAERFPHHVSPVSDSVVWGLSPEGVMTWSTQGTFLQSFDPAKAAPGVSLGMWLEACAAGSGCALVASIQGVSLWNVAARQLIAYRSCSCSRVAFNVEKQLGVILVGERLRLIGVCKSASADALVGIKSILDDKECETPPSFATGTSGSESVENDPDVEALSLPSLQFPVAAEVLPPAASSTCSSAMSDSSVEDDVTASDQRLSRIFSELQLAKPESSDSQTVEEEEVITLPVILTEDLDRATKNMESLLQLKQSSCLEDVDPSHMVVLVSDSDDDESGNGSDLSSSQPRNDLRQSRGAFVDSSDQRDDGDSSSEEVVFLHRPRATTVAAEEEPAVPEAAPPARRGWMTVDRPRASTAVDLLPGGPPDVTARSTRVPALSMNAPQSRAVSGYLRKRGSKGAKKLKDKYFELIGSVLLFKDSHEKEGNVSRINLSEVTQINCVGANGASPMFVLGLPSRSVELEGSVTEIQMWLEAILAVRDIPVTADEVARTWSDFFSNFTRSPRPSGLSASRSSPPRSPRSPNRSPRVLQKVSSFVSSLSRGNSGGKLGNSNLNGK